MVRKKSIVSGNELKDFLEQYRDMFRELVCDVAQQTLEAEMEIALGAASA